MSKKNRLNGLPNTLIQKYFSTLNHYKVGYMADWIWIGLRSKNVTTVTIDFLNDSANPSILEESPIFVYTPDLRMTIMSKLKNEGFDIDYFIEGSFSITHRETVDEEELLNVVCTLVDHSGFTYQSKTYTEFVYTKNIKLSDA